MLEERLAGHRYLLGDAITEADVRLWVTLARFDAVYYSHFKCNLRRITDYPSLWGYARDLYALPAFRNNTRFDQIKRHYYTHAPAPEPVPDRAGWPATRLGRRRPAASTWPGADACARPPRPRR